MPTRTGPYVDKGKDPIRQNDTKDRLNDKYELDIEKNYRHGEAGGSSKLPKHGR
jgi:hypothetical protein